MCETKQSVLFSGKSKTEGPQLRGNLYCVLPLTIQSPTIPCSFKIVMSELMACIQVFYIRVSPR